MMAPERLEAVRQSIANEEKFRYDHSAEVRADRRLLLRDRDELAALLGRAADVLLAATSGQLPTLGEQMAKGNWERERVSVLRDIGVALALAKAEQVTR